jgi:ribosome-associated protein
MADSALDPSTDAAFEPAVSDVAPTRRESQTPVTALAAAAVDALLDRKAQEIRVIDLRGKGGVADLLVLATGATDTQVRALSESVRQGVKEEYGEKPWRSEGTELNQWVVLDYVDLVVHLFQPERRSFYGLERLWGDAPYEDIDPDADSSEGMAMLHPSSE